MTVQTTESQKSFDGNGIATEFSFDFPFFQKSDIVVVLYDSNGNGTAQVLNSDYTIPGISWIDGGQVTMVAAPETGETLIVSRVLDLVQSAGFRNLGDFRAEVHEDAFDKIIMILQQQNSTLGQCLQAPGSVTLSQPSLPTPEANKLLAWNSVGDAIENQELHLSTSDEFAVASLPVLKAITGEFDGQVVYLSSGGRSGPFIWSDSDLSAKVSADIQQGVYIAPDSDLTGASGAWVRQFGQNTVATNTSPDVDVLWFGGTGDKSVDDSSYVQAALDFLSDGLCGGVLVNNAFNLNGTTVTLNAKTEGNWKIHGAGELYTGALKLSDCNGGEVSGIKFSEEDSPEGSATGSQGVVIERTRKVLITGNTFTNKDKSVATEADSTAGFHDNGLIRVIANTFDNVNYAIHLNEFDTSVSGVFVCNDWHFQNNMVSESYITAVWTAKIDGIVIQGNTIFSSNQLETKEQNIALTGLSDQVVITGNQLFNPGTNCVYAFRPKTININNNNMPWAGTKEPASAIFLEGEQAESDITITGNTITGATQDSIRVDMTFTRPTIVGNTLVGDENPVYYGTEDYLSLDRYAINIVDYFGVVAGNPMINSNYCRDYDVGRAVKIELSGEVDINNGYRGYSSVDITSAATVANLADYRNETDEFTGVLNIQANNGDNYATYIVHVARTPAGDEVNLISSLGLTAGGSANHPSVTFSLSGNSLVATPVGSAAGTVDFDIRSERIIPYSI